MNGEELRRAIRLILVIIALAVWGIVPVFGGDMTLADGQQLRDAEVIAWSGDCLHVRHRYGISRVMAENLTDLQKAPYGITPETIEIARAERAAAEAKGLKRIEEGRKATADALGAALALQATAEFAKAMQATLDAKARPVEMRVLFKMEGGLVAEIMEPAVANFGYGMASIGGGNKPKANNIRARGSGRLIFLAGVDKEPGTYLRGRFRREGSKEITFPGLPPGRFMARWVVAK